MEKENQQNEIKKEENLEEVQLFDFSKKPKKKRTKKKDKQQDVVNKEYKDPYSYEFLLERVKTILTEKNPSVSQTKKIHLKPVQLEQQAKKKYKWTNFHEFCEILNRSPEHLSAFVSSELGIEILLTADFLKIEKKRLGKEELQSIIKRYILEYVKCSLCHSAQTTMTKDPKIRQYVMKCESCRSSKTVQPIKGVHKKH